MITSQHKKIAIIGCAGSGKTTLAFKLKDQLGLPLYHLDQYYWKAGWQRVDLQVFEDAHAQLCNQSEWLMEGVYLKFLPYRAARADVIIFLDVPRYKCLWYVIKRAVLNLGKELPGSSHNCKQRIFDREFMRLLKWIWNFNKRYGPQITETLGAYKSTKQIIILKSLEELDQLDVLKR